MRSPRRFVALALGVVMAVALVPPAWSAGDSSAGPAYSWGDNRDGRLGTGTLAPDELVPTAMVGPTGPEPLQFLNIAAGSSHGCGRVLSGAAYCWGDDSYGQLGNGATADDSVPTEVVGGYIFNGDLAAGSNSTCGYVRGGGDDTIYCWGDNTRGKLGNGTTGGFSSVPVAVVEPAGGFAGVGSVSVGGNSACAINDDSVYCWGDNSSGQLGDGTTTDDSAPSPLAKFVTRPVAHPQVFGVYATDDTIYAATAGGGLSISTNGGNSFTTRNAANSSLGSDNVRGVYAVGSTIYAATIGGLSISTNGGISFTNYTTTNSLGSNDVRGVYAVGSTIYAATTGGLSISTNGGTSFTNYTTTDGLGSSQLSGVYAVGSTIYAATAGGLSISTSGGTSFTNYTTSNSGLGRNDLYGVYAVGSTIYAATNGDGLSISIPAYRFVDVSVGGFFACGVTRLLDDTGTGVCWGNNFAGRLGKGTSNTFAPEDRVPQPIARPLGAASDLNLRSIDAGAGHACAISMDDSVYCWGYNRSGQVGNGTSDDSVPTPTRVVIPGGAPVRDVSAGEWSTCAVTDDTAYCWGDGYFGQLGDGATFGTSPSPVAVTLSGIGSGNSPVQVTSGGDWNAFVALPRMVVTSGSTAFPTVQVGSAASTTSVTVKNNRPWPVTVTSVAASGAGGSISPGGTCGGSTLSVDDTCLVNLSWSPTTAGSLNAALTVTYRGDVAIPASQNSSTFTLTGTATPAPVYEPPSQPRNVTATAGNASATVSWATPVEPGSFPIASYTVTANPGGRTCITIRLTCTVTGLTNGTAYTFTVTATNEAGTGLPSARSNAVTPQAPPSPPRDVVATAANASADVTWLAPADPGAAPITYTVTSSPGGLTCSTSALTCTVTGLTNGTAYTFTVTATSAAGTSEPSASSAAVTPRQSTITIVGSRSTDGARLEIDGTSTDLVGKYVRPWFRFPGQTSYTQGSAVITVAADGAFTWSRKANKKTYVYFTDGAIKSNTVVIGAR